MTERSKTSARFRHLPPTAIRVKRGDIWRGVASLFKPDDALARFRLAVIQQTGSPACYFIGSGRAALSIILLGLRRLSQSTEVGRIRSRVIIPAYSCPTMVQSVLKADLEPVLCDVSVHTLDLDRGKLESLIDDNVLAIVPAHLYGLAQDERDLVELGRQRGIWIVEDAAQAFGATLGGRMVGTWGDAGLYSMGRSKCIPAGHGGVIVAQEGVAAAIEDALHEAVGEGRPGGKDWAALAAFVGYGPATHPAGWWFISRSPLNPADEGMDFDTLPPVALRRLSAVHAGLGASIVERLDSVQAEARRNAGRLMAELAGFDFVTLPHVPPDAVPAFLRLPVVLDRQARADAVFDLLSRQGIGVSRSYWRTLPDLFSRVLPAGEENFPGAVRLATCLLTLPTHAYLRQGDFANIVHAFQAVED
ncbi:MAG TPA: DegT/DnrJ/EryC1/StrS family aminotransferase [Anaerolineae bacterium]|nr:DegT/DnrJ/EryC1/StrS family aminotransferase [Anaerolineae bacterium]